ncbi:MAG TPA: gamma-glutamyl-gamma-aminobutyrate hydrolase family protein [Microbacteriaceae bacterium]|nr:gamma-glutamyl-gamma-aminobutyrate hydrolase family protein [Microbacteriaceae bacterium]
MSNFVVDPSTFTSGDEDPNGPIVPVVGSMTFPGMDETARDMTRDFAAVAFDAVRAAGGRPRLVDSAATNLPENEAVLAEAGAILFLGGGDVDGSCYGYEGPAPDNEYGVDKKADVFCIDLINAAVDKDMPLLALCRGSQLLNVAHGGTLIPDIANWELHRGKAGSAELFIDEEVMLEADSKIASILGETIVTVRNGHHQAVDSVGENLKVAARAHDGIVEATEHRSAAWVLGLQWHPEEPNANPEHQKKIFGELVDQAKSYLAR